MYAEQEQEEEEEEEESTSCAQRKGETGNVYLNIIRGSV
jgi:hypothetical protein